MNKISKKLKFVFKNCKIKYKVKYMKYLKEISKYKYRYILSSGKHMGQLKIMSFKKFNLCKLLNYIFKNNILYY